MRHVAELASRRANQSRGQNYDSPSGRHAFHHPRTSLGATGHWIHILTVAAPLVIGELITDPDKKWRALRFASIGGALLSEAVWTHRLSKDRQKDEDTHAALKSCAERSL
jgi:hypothetical protein